MVSIRNDGDSAETPGNPPTDRPTGKPADAPLPLFGNAEPEESTEEPGRVPLEDIQSMLLAFAEAKGITLATQKERRAYLNSSPYFYEAKNLIEAAGGLEKAKAFITAQAARQRPEGRASWGLDRALRDYWQCREAENASAGQSGQAAARADRSRCPSCGTLLGGPVVKVETEAGIIETAILARCPKCGRITGMQPLEGLSELGITPARLAEILRQSRLESFTQSEWAEWIRRTE